MCEHVSPAKPKAGFKTSEFWLALASIGNSAAVSLGVVPLDSDLKHAASMLASMGLTLWIGGQYINGRNALKSGGDGQPERRELLQVVRGLLDKIDPPPADEPASTHEAA